MRKMELHTQSKQESILVTQCKRVGPSFLTKLQVQKDSLQRATWYCQSTHVAEKAVSASAELVVSKKLRCMQILKKKTDVPDGLNTSTLSRKRFCVPETC